MKHTSFSFWFYPFSCSSSSSSTRTLYTHTQKTESHLRIKYVLDCAQAERILPVFQSAIKHSNRIPLDIFLPCRTRSIIRILTPVHIVHRNIYMYAPVSFWLLLFIACHFCYCWCCCRSNSRTFACICVHWNCFVHVVAELRLPYKNAQSSKTKQKPFQSHTSFSETFRNATVAVTDTDSMYCRLRSYKKYNVS